MDRDDFTIAVFLVVCEQNEAIRKRNRIRRGGFAPAYKGFIDAYRHALLAERHGITVVTPVRKNMQTDLPNLCSSSANMFESSSKLSVLI